MRTVTGPKVRSSIRGMGPSACGRGARGPLHQRDEGAVRIPPQLERAAEQRATLVAAALLHRELAAQELREAAEHGVHLARLGFPEGPSPQVRILVKEPGGFGI